MRSTARAYFGRPKISKIDAHTCPEGGDASKPGPTCDATELLGSRVKERAVQKYRRRAARTDRARSRVGRGYGALAAMPLGPPDVPRPWHGTGVVGCEPAALLREAACRLGSSIIKIASLKKKVHAKNVP